MTIHLRLLRSLVVLAGASVAGLASAQFSFPTFTGANVGSGAGQVTLNGDAALASSALRLTANGDGYANGTAFYNTKQSVSGDFSTAFRYTMTGGDGLAFLFNDNAAGASLYNSGYYGGYMGYIGSSRTLAVEFDNFQNGGDDTVGVAVRAGDAPAFGSELGGYATTVTGTHDVRITHSAANVLSIFFDNMTTPVLTVPNVSLAGYSDASGLSYLGFSAGQATAQGDQSILSWRSPASNPTPEPGSLVALGLGFGTVVARRRRARA